MFGLQLDQVGVAIVTAFIMLVSWCVTHYFGRKTTKSKAIQTHYPRCKTTESKIIQTIDNKKVAQTQTNLVKTSCAQTDTKFTELLTNHGNKKVGLHEKFDKFCETCEASTGNEAVGFCKMCEKFMCLSCCKHHEKIPLSMNHVLLGKQKFKGMRNQTKMFDKRFVLLQNYHFTGCVCTYSSQFCTSGYSVHIQTRCLTLDVTDNLNSFRCLVQKYNKRTNKHELAFQWQDKMSRQFHEKTIWVKYCTPVDICTYRYTSKGEKNIFGWYFTIPKEQKICKCTNDADLAADLESFRTCGECHGIAVFNEGLAISLQISTNYSLPEWQVQFISFNGEVRRQICFDNEGEPLFKEPKHLTSNDAEDILFVSDQGNHSIIALDIKGYTLFKYTHETIKTPLGLTCDDEGNIYVASGNKVVQIDQHGTKSRVILSSKEGNDVELIDVCYSKVTNELAVLSKSAEVTVLKPLP